MTRATPAHRPVERVHVVGPGHLPTGATESLAAGLRHAGVKAGRGRAGQLAVRHNKRLYLITGNGRGPPMVVRDVVGLIEQAEREALATQENGRAAQTAGRRENAF